MLKCNAWNRTVHWQCPINIVRTLKIKPPKVKILRVDGKNIKCWISVTFHELCSYSTSTDHTHHLIKGSVAYRVKFLRKGIVHRLPFRVWQMMNEPLFSLTVLGCARPMEIATGFPMGYSDKAPKPYLMQLPSLFCPKQYLVWQTQTYWDMPQFH